MFIEIEVFSGRPNPGWQLDPPDAVLLRVRVDRLLPYRGPDPAEPLGYRGLRIHAGTDGASILVSQGAVLVQDAAGPVRRLADEDRAIECWLLRTAEGRVDEDLRRMALACIEPGCA